MPRQLRSDSRVRNPEGIYSMEKVVTRAGIWFAVFLVALWAAVVAHDRPFAIQMAIVAVAALAGLLVTLTATDYGALARNVIKAPDQGKYDDDPIRWGVIATLFWGMAGFLAGLFIALQLTFPELNFEP